MLLVPAAAHGLITIQAPGLEPEFRTGQTDYVIAPEFCGEGGTTPFAVRPTKGSRARLGKGLRFRGRSRVRVAHLVAGQALRITLIKGGGTRKRFSARCLPDDFPEFSSTRTGPTQSGMFAVDPIDPEADSPNYSIVFDAGGAPIWWRRVDPAAIDSAVLPGGLIAYATYFGGGFGRSDAVRYELRRPDGSLAGTVRTVGSTTDHHELEPTAGGDFLTVSYVPRDLPVDTAEFNGDTDAHVVEAVVQRISPSGEVLWRWDAASHIALAETGRWWSQLQEPYDIHHINSVDEITDGSGDLLISLRHTDAVYRVDGGSGEVIWKLGGTATPQSLDFEGEQFGAQHDARWLGGGQISVYDNSTGLDRSPRVVRIQVDEAAGRAHVVESVSEPSVTSSFCCGSARVLEGGNWLVSWGGTNQVSELTPAGEPVMQLHFAQGSFTYRAQPVGDAITAAELRAGMDAQVPWLP